MPGFQNCVGQCCSRLQNEAKDVACQDLTQQVQTTQCYEIIFQPAPRTHGHTAVEAETQHHKAKHYKHLPCPTPMCAYARAVHLTCACVCLAVCVTASQTLPEPNHLWNTLVMNKICTSDAKNYVGSFENGVNCQNTSKPHIYQAWEVADSNS